MKKLMIAAAIVCAAALSQAASFTWATDSVGAIGADDLAAGLAANKSYAADSGNDLDTAGWTVAYQLVLSYGGQTDTLTGTVATDGLSGGIYDDTMASELVVAGRDIDYTLTFTSSIVDGKDAPWDVTSNVMSGTWHADDSGDIGFSAGVASSWTTAPEPTSGLLLLLGVGALALKRKRA